MQVRALLVKKLETWQRVLSRLLVVLTLARSVDRTIWKMESVRLMKMYLGGVLTCSIKIVVSVAVQFRQEH